MEDKPDPMVEEVKEYQQIEKAPVDRDDITTVVFGNSEMGDQLRPVRPKSQTTSSSEEDEKSLQEENKELWEKVKSIRSQSEISKKTIESINKELESTSESLREAE